jgi:hypothetical protein
VLLSLCRTLPGDAANRSMSYIVALEQRHDGMQRSCGGVAFLSLVKRLARPAGCVEGWQARGAGVAALGIPRGDVKGD